MHPVLELFAFWLIAERAIVWRGVARVILTGVFVAFSCHLSTFNTISFDPSTFRELCCNFIGAPLAATLKVLSIERDTLFVFAHACIFGLLAVLNFHVHILTYLESLSNSFCS